MKRPNYRPGGESSSLDTGGLLSALPLLSEHLTAASYSDGTARLTSSLLIFADPAAGVWKATLRDRQEGYCLWVSARTVDDLLLAVEECLGSDDPSHWRRDRPAGGGGSSSRKK